MTLSTVDITAKINKLTQRKIYLWEKADNTKLEELTRSINTDFHSKFHPMIPIQEKWGFIKKNLLKILEDSTCNIKTLVQAWITRDIRDYQDERKGAFSKHGTPTIMPTSKDTNVLKN